MTKPQGSGMRFGMFVPDGARIGQVCMKCRHRCRFLLLHDDWQNMAWCLLPSCDTFKQREALHCAMMQAMVIPHDPVTATTLQKSSPRICIHSSWNAICMCHLWHWLEPASELMLRCM